MEWSFVTVNSFFSDFVSQMILTKSNFPFDLILLITFVKTEFPFSSNVNT